MALIKNCTVFKPAGMILAALGLLCWATSAAASPTSNEFEACHLDASGYLKACLDRNGTEKTAANRCWVVAKERNARCYGQVYRSHQRPDQDARNAEERARAESAARLLRQNDPNRE